MSRYAIISDIHGNLHAFEAILEGMTDLGIEAVVCLGDIVGYGPHPGPCLDLVVRCASVCVRGNHDEAVVDPDVAACFNGAARAAILWTRDQLGPLHLHQLAQLRPAARLPLEGGEELLCVHDSPWPGPTDYVHDKVIAANAFRGVDVPICLLGHTHVPLVFETAERDPERLLGPTDLDAHLPADGVPIALDPERRYICNPGSVGQPRDCDPRASFAVLDTEERTFTVHRRAYDVAAAQQASMEAGLPGILAERLAVGA